MILSDMIEESITAKKTISDDLTLQVLSYSDRFLYGPSSERLPLASRDTWRTPTQYNAPLFKM